MATHGARCMKNAKKYASRYRKKGYDVSIYKKKKGYGISVTRK